MSLKSMSSTRKNTFYHPKRFRSFSKASTNASDDDSDSDEDEAERRKYISLQGGQCLLWSATKFGNNWDLTQDHTKFFNHDYPAESGGKHTTSFKRHIDGRHSLRQIRIRNPPLNLDNIQLNENSEYGFNPNRPTGSKAPNSVKLRPLSLYSPPREKVLLKSSSSDASEKFQSNKVNGLASSDNFIKRTVSFARNDYEAQLEKKVLSLRAQPSDLQFQGSKGKVNEEELAEDLANARRRRFVRRQLSFDSHPRKKWRKTLSLDSGLATDSLRSLKSNSFKKQNEDVSHSAELLDNQKEKEDIVTARSCKSVEFLGLITTESPRDHIDAENEDLNCQSSAHEDTVEQVVGILSPPKIDEKVQNIVVLLTTSSKTNKSSEKTKRRGSIPQFLSAFRLPNKRTFQKFIRKKTPEAVENVSPNSQLDSEVLEVSVTTEQVVTNGLVSEEEKPSHPINMNPKVDTFEEIESVNDSREQLVIDKSCSSYSLPRVDEEKESFGFGSPLERRSKSSCSISKQHLRQLQEPVLQRRLSDTVLTFSEKSARCSPGRKFVRRLLSPVVCGLPSPDRYGLLSDSMQSLGSFDSASIASDSDIAYPQLFDFGSQELAEEMTLIDKELLIRIPWEELSTLGWMSSDKFLLAPNIMKMVQFFNRLAMLVSTSVLNEETTFRRAKIIRKVIKLACRCRFAKNYNSLKAVLGGLQCTPIFRLKETWKLVPSRYRRMFRELSELMSENNNFSIYRQELSTSIRNPPCIPFLGNFLTQVAHIHAYVAVQVKYKANSFLCTDAHRNEQNEHNVNRAIQMEDADTKDGDKLGTNNTEDITDNTHSRSDSNDSGVVLNLHRLSRTSDEFEPSPRESCVNSPEDENRKFEDVFDKHETNTNGLTLHLKRIHSQSSPSFVKKSNSLEQLKMRMSPSKDLQANRKRYYDIASVINNRPAERSDHDELYECELQFWKYQICAVQYNLVPRTYIRRYLMNSPFSTEEENYKLSLQREPPRR